MSELFRRRPDRRLRELERRARTLCAERARRTDAAGVRWSDFAVCESTRAAIDRALAREPSGELVIGRFDEAGRLFGPYGELPGLGFEPVAEERFEPRRRRTVDVVLANGRVLVRKDFRGDRRRFVNEWYCLAALAGVANVPAVPRAEPERTRIYKEWIPGRKLRDLMIDAGARLLDEDLEGDPELVGLGPAARAEVVCRRGQRFLRACLTPAVLAAIEQQLDGVHGAGITGFGFTPGNVILDPGSRPWLFDFDGARVHRSSSGVRFAYRRAQDRLRFNRHFGTRLPLRVSS